MFAVLKLSPRDKPSLLEKLIALFKEEKVLLEQKKFLEHEYLELTLELVSGEPDIKRKNRLNRMLIEAKHFSCREIIATEDSEINRLIVDGGMAITDTINYKKLYLPEIIQFIKGDAQNLDIPIIIYDPFFRHIDSDFVQRLAEVSKNIMLVSEKQESCLKLSKELMEEHGIPAITGRADSSSKEGIVIAFDITYKFYYKPGRAVSVIDFTGLSDSSSGENVIRDFRLRIPPAHKEQLPKGVNQTAFLAALNGPRYPLAALVKGS